MEELAVKIIILPLVISILVGVPVYALDSELFLEGIEGAIKLNFLDGSSYQGQVEDCPIKTNCMQGTGVYIKAGSIYMASLKITSHMARVFLYTKTGKVIRGVLRMENFMGKE